MKQMFLALIRNRLSAQHALADAQAFADQPGKLTAVREIGRAELRQAAGGLQGETQVAAASPYRGW